MTENAPVGRRFSRRAVILTIVIVVVVLAATAFVVHAAVSGSSGDPKAGSTAGSPSFNPSPSPTSGGYTPAPTPSTSSKPSTPVTEPTGDASPGTQAKPVPLTATAQPVSGVHVKLTSLAAVQGKGNGVGEIDGPALKFNVVFTNDTAATIPLSSVIVDVTSGSSQTPADELMSLRKPLPQTLAKGATATGTFVFTLAEAQRSSVRITVDYHVGIPITVFTGSAPR